MERPSIVNSTRRTYSRSASPTSPPSSPSSQSSQSSTSLLLTLPKKFTVSLATRAWIIIMFIFSVVTIASMLESFILHQHEAKGCGVPYMRPKYIKQTGFDSEMTRFAGKYGLYLYRELDVDISDEVTGTPVLFIPGHAGSYKQVRTIAAASAYQYYHHDHDQSAGSSNLDVFTVDFHEEFSALHGQSLLEQAEYINDAIDYILKLYPQARQRHPIQRDKLPDPTSIILIGHSMGGIVARTTFTLSNYQPGSIYTVITLSTPHLLPPAPFDWQLSAIYDSIDAYWRHGYLTETDYYRSSLHDVILISIAGGTLDNTICSDSTNVGNLVPPTNGFTVFSTAIPHVWSAADHNEILACHPLDRILSRALLDTVDTRRGSQTKSRADRMAIMQKAFLSGLEDRHGDGSDLNLGNWTFVSLDQSMVLNRTTYLSTKTIPGAPLTLLALNDYGDRNHDGLTFLTDQHDGRYELLLCSKEQSSRMVGCRSVHSAVAVPVPASNENNIYPFSGDEFVFASLTSKESVGYDYVGVVDHHHQQQQSGSGSGFFLVDAFSAEKNVQVINKSMLGIAWDGIQATVPASLFSVLHIPSIENPMLAYHLKITGPTCTTPTNNNFSPFLRQSITTMYESKFYVHLAAGKDTDHQHDDDITTHLSVHGRTAFSSVNINSSGNRGLMMQFWMDSQCDQPLKLDLSIDWYVTLGRIGFRNGMVLLTFSFLVVMLVFVGQLRCYNQSCVFPSFGEGLAYFYRRTFPWTLVVISLASIYQCHHSTKLAEVEDTASWIVWTDILTGNSDAFFWWVPALGWVISTGMISGIAMVMDGFLRWCTSAIMIYPWRTWTSDESQQQKIQRRIIATLVLFMLVATVIPYQFVFVVTFLVHGVTCIRTLRRSRTKLPHRPLDRTRTNRYHYIQTLLLLFLTLLPFNLPILVVWIRNVSVYWSTPFSSDHSVFAIAPFLIHVEMLTTQMKMMVPRNSSQQQQQKHQHSEKEQQQQGGGGGQWWLGWLTYGLMYGIIVYAFLYGVKYPHSIYFLSNYLIIWLLFLHFCQSRYSHSLFRTLMHCFTSPHKHRRSS